MKQEEFCFPWNIFKVQSFQQIPCNVLKDLLAFSLLFECIVVFYGRNKRTVFLLPTGKWYWTCCTGRSCTSALGKSSPLVGVCRLLEIVPGCHQSGHWDPLVQMMLMTFLSRFPSTCPEANLLQNLEPGLYSETESKFESWLCSLPANQLFWPFVPLHCSTLALVGLVVIRNDHFALYLTLGYS